MIRDLRDGLQIQVSLPLGVSAHYSIFQGPYSAVRPLQPAFAIPPMTSAPDMNAAKTAPQVALAPSSIHAERFESSQNLHRYRIDLALTVLLESRRIGTTFSLPQISWSPASQSGLTRIHGLPPSPMQPPPLHSSNSPGRPSTSTNHTDFHPLVLGLRYPTRLDLAANQARRAKCKCFASRRLDRLYLVKAKEESRPVCGAQPLDLEIPLREGKTPHEQCGFTYLCALIGVGWTSSNSGGPRSPRKELTAAVGKVWT